MTVTIDINRDEIVKLHALRIAGDGPGCVCKYRLYDEHNMPFAVIDHNYDNGAESLAVAMLNNYINHKKIISGDKGLNKKQMRFCDVGGFKIIEG